MGNFKSICFDPKLVMPWSLELSRQEPFEYPFRADYESNSKRLMYLAALHSCDLQSETFKMIHQVFDKEQIDFVILEGIRSSKGLSPREVVAWATRQKQTGIYEGFETAFTIALCAGKNIPFTGGEPEDEFIFSQIGVEGYTSRDLVFYYFVQQVFQAHENQIFRGNDLSSEFNHFLEKKNKEFKLDESPNFSDFQSWYLEKNGRPFIVSEITSEVLAPFEKGELYTQKISSAVCKARDQFLITRIEDAVNNYNSVLVIYGGSHWSTQKKSLEAGFGKPKFTKL